MSRVPVFIVDDDRAVRDSLRWVLEPAGYSVTTFESGEAFLAAYHNEPGCLLLDMSMPGMSGIDLQKRLNHMGANLCVIFISAHGTVPTAVSAMRDGAVDFLIKPFDNNALLDRVAHAMQRVSEDQEYRAEKAAQAARLAGLTEREREVMDAVVEGLTNKQIARKLLISIKTVETHRANVMLKTGASSVAELVKLAVNTHG